MKKLLAAVSAFAVVLALTACGAEPAENEISKLMNEGYNCMASTACENVWKGLFYQEDNYDTIYKVVANMSDKEYQAYNDADFDEEIINKILFGLTEVEVTDISDMVPTQEEMDVYVGKTIGDMEAD